MTRRQDARHDHHRLPRRRQDDSGPPRACPCWRAADRGDRQRVRRTRHRRRDCCAVAASPGCEDDDIIELANGCLCCTVADDFVPTIEALLDAPAPPEHILIETSGLALPKPLLKAFGWPAMRSRVTVDGVIAVVDGPAVAAGRFADDPEAVAGNARRTRRSITTIRWPKCTRTSCSRRYGGAEQDRSAGRRCASHGCARTSARLPRAVKWSRRAKAGSTRPCCSGWRRRPRTIWRRVRRTTTRRTARTSTTISRVSWCRCRRSTRRSRPVARLRGAAATSHDILRIKGFRRRARQADAAGGAGRGRALSAAFRSALGAGRGRRGQLVVIGERGLDRAAIAAAIAG